MSTRDLYELLTARPPLLAAVLVLLSLLLARLVDWITVRWVRSWVGKTETDLDDRIVALLHRPIRVSVVLAGLWLATEILELPAGPDRLVRGVLLTLAILVWSVFAVRFTTLTLELLSEHQERFRAVEPRTLALFQNIARVVLVGAAVYFVFLAWEIDVTAWLASAGIIGVAVGFAAKDTLANLFSGMFILADAPYELGDFINLDTGERGRVTHIGIRSTRLLTRDDVEVTVPNAVIANAKIVNESGGPWEKERIRIRVSVAYGSDVDRVREVLLAIARKHDGVCAQPHPRVRFRAFGDSGLELELMGWIDEPVLRGRITDALHVAVYKAFRAEGIEIPYPKRDVYLYRPGAETPPEA